MWELKGRKVKLEENMWELTHQKWELAAKKVKLTHQASQVQPIKTHMAAFRLQRKATKKAFAQANALTI